jgi:hypothetical protein
MFQTSTLDALVAYIQEENFYLASQDDADFFRRLTEKKPIQSPLIEKPKLNNLPKTQAFVSNVTLKAAVMEPTLEPKIDVEPKIEKPKPQLKPKPIINKVEIKEEFQDPIKQTLENFDDIRRIVSIVAPEFGPIDEIPSDMLAQKISTRWKTKNQTAPISILSFAESDEQKALLEKIAIAIDVYFGPAKLIHAETIEKEKQWDAFLSVEELKTIICCDHTLWQLSLVKHYKENPQDSKRMLGNKDLFLLPDLSLYMKDPSLKRSLWKALCQKFS